MRKTNLSLEQEKEINNLYIEGNCILKISKIFEVSTWKIVEILDRYNVKRRTNKEMRKKFSCNSNYFNLINTKEKAYFLGLLYADGWNNEKNRQVALQLKDSDSKVVQLLKDHLEYTGNLMWINRSDKCPTHSDIVRLCIVDDTLSFDLAKLGCVQNKTFKIIDIPSQVSEKFISHFIRGYFDGDGSIHNDITTNNLKFQIVGNKPMLERITKELVENCGVNNNKIHGNKLTKLISFGGNIVCKKIYDYIYNDCGELFIDRKKKIFEEKWKTYYQ